MYSTNVETGIGANFTTYTMPDAIKPYYGSHPMSVNMYLRLRLKSEMIRDLSG